ncbi:MAG TPA: TonB-dependent receptor [Caulobacteraceae bacterium]|jgi:iron complex outermembrane receptor protein
MRRILASVAGAGAALAGEPGFTQEREEETSVSELVVTAPADAARVLPPSAVLTSEELLVRQPTGLDDALDSLPGVAVRVNSRGESVARVRGAEERQTQVFLDGAPLAVPWDGRVDLGLLPVGLIGHVEVVKGAAPIEYGTNTVAGVADLRTRRGAEAGTGLTAFGELGTLGYQNAAAVATWAGGRYEATAAVGRSARDALPVADLDALPFNETGEPGRTNTDLDAWSGFAAVGADFGPVRARASLLHLDAERGIAPEAHLDPAVESPRFWRYPDIRLTQLTLNAEADLGPAVLRGVGWGQWFGQTIDAYRDVTYSTLRSQEVDEDDTYGGRLTLTHHLGPVRLRWNASAQRSTHDQLDTAFPVVAPPLDRRFRQDLFSVGVEADHPIGETLRATWGFAYDRAETPLTGDKPAQAPMDAPAFSAALRWSTSEELSVTASAGRRTRFPTARELFGEALGRFQPNSDLQPETAWLADLVFDWRRGPVSVGVNPYLILSEGTISQRVIVVDGVSRRQRFNLNGAESYGADLAVRARLSPNWAVEAGLDMLSAHASDDDGGARLPQRPSYEWDAALEWNWRALTARAEMRRIGEAVDLAPSGGQADLPPSTEFNLRAAWAVPRPPSGQMIELTGAIDNLTDEVVLPQLGLPSPGRTLRLGLRLRS